MFTDTLIYASIGRWKVTPSALRQRCNSLRVASAVAGTSSVGTTVALFGLRLLGHDLDTALQPFLLLCDDRGDAALQGCAPGAGHHQPSSPGTQVSFAAALRAVACSLK